MKQTDRNVLGHPVQWIWVMRKLNTPLSVSSYPIGTRMGQLSFGYPLPLTCSWYDYGDIYFDQEEINLIRSFLQYRVSNDATYPDRIAKQIFRLSQIIRRQKSPITSLKRMSLEKLVRLLKRNEQPFLHLLGFMSYRGSIQMSDVLHEKVGIIITNRAAARGEANRIQYILEQLKVPTLASVVAEEREYSLRLARGFRQLSKRAQARRVATYHKKFDWLSYHWFVGHPQSDEAIRKRLEHLAPNAARELGRIRRDRRLHERVVASIVKRLGLSAAEKRLVRQFRTWLFLRTFVKDNLNLASYKLLPILYEIAERVALPRTSTVYLTLDEIHRINKLSKHELRSKVETRKNGFSAGIVRLTLSFRPFGARSVDTTRAAGEIHGSVAFPGKVSGAVRIVRSPKEQSKVKRGDVLVTSMTTPDLLPAMERATAFVTDEGGITSHAAIVAREMKKPCVIGTRVATKVLKDGDRVEVDATKGVVRKLNRQTPKPPNP